MLDESKSISGVVTSKGEQLGLYLDRFPDVIASNNFKHKQFSNWAFSISITQNQGDQRLPLFTTKNQVSSTRRNCEPPFPPHLHHCGVDWRFFSDSFSVN